MSAPEDCVAVGFSGEGRCVERAVAGGLCDGHHASNALTATTPDADVERVERPLNAEGRYTSRFSETGALVIEEGRHAALTADEREAIGETDERHEYPTETDDGLVMRCRCGATPPSHLLGEQVDEAFWLWMHRRSEQHAAVERIIAARAGRAWDEGWTAGCNDCQYGDEDARPWTPNPYHAHPRPARAES